VSDSGISWATCKSAPHSRQITLPAPHHSVYYRPDALPVAQPTASKHWMQKSTHINAHKINSAVTDDSSSQKWEAVLCWFAHNLSITIPSHFAIIIRAARKSQNHDHLEYCDLRCVPRFFTITLILCHGGLCTKSAQWSFPHANLALQLMAAFNARAWIEKNLYFDVPFNWFFCSLTNLSYFCGLWSYINTAGNGMTVLYYSYWCSFTMQPKLTFGTINN